MYYNAFYTYQYGLFKGINFVGSDKYMLFASFVSLVGVIFSLIFSGAVLFVSSLTMQKQKRIVIIFQVLICPNRSLFFSFQLFRKWLHILFLPFLN